jgi:hypothetical protein
MTERGQKLVLHAALSLGLSALPALVAGIDPHQPDRMNRYDEKARNVDHDVALATQGALASFPQKPRSADMREVVNAVSTFLQGGCRWRPAAQKTSRRIRRPATPFEVGGCWVHGNGYTTVLALPQQRNDDKCAQSSERETGNDAADALGYEEGLNKKDYNKAISDYTEAIRLNPNLAFAYTNRGLAYK